MLNQLIRGQWDRAMRPVGLAMGRVGIGPNLITLLGLAVQVVVAVQIVRGELVAAGVIMIAAALFDALDGAVAKARGMTSRFGALFDSTVDRLSDALVFLPVAWLYGVSPTERQAGERWVAVAALVALVSSYLVSYVKARAEGLGFRCGGGIAERAERLILMIIALVFSGLLPAILVGLAALSIVTFFQRLASVRAQAAGGP